MDQDGLKHLARLCRISLDDAESEKLAVNLKKILRYVDQLKEVDTEGIEPCHIVHPEPTVVMREDEIGATLDRQKFLDNAPEHTGGMVRVPKVL